MPEKQTRGPGKQYGDMQFLSFFRDNNPEPMTAREVADAIGCYPDTARDRLDRLVDEGRLAKKVSGATGIYWLPAEERGER